MTADTDEDARRPTGRHQIGQDLSALSVDELAARVALLREEIARIEAAIAAKTAHRSAADRVFGGS